LGVHALLLLITEIIGGPECFRLQCFRLVAAPLSVPLRSLCCRHSRSIQQTHILTGQSRSSWRFRPAAAPT